MPIFHLHFSHTYHPSFIFKHSMSDISLSEIDEIENDLNQSIDSTTFGIPENSQTKSAETPKSPIISSSVETNQTNFLSAKESFDSLDSHNPEEESTSHFTSPTKSTISLFGTDVLAFFSPSSTKVEEEETDNMSKTVAKGTMPASEEEPHFDAATQ